MGYRYKIKVIEGKKLRAGSTQLPAFAVSASYQNNLLTPSQAHAAYLPFEKRFSCSQPKFLPPLIKNITAKAVDSDKERHILDIKLFNRFAAELIKGDLLGILDMARYKRARPADGTEVGCAVSADGLINGGAALTLSDRCHEAHVVERRRERIHTAGSRRSAGADFYAIVSRRRSGIVDDGVLNVKREWLSGFQE